MSAKVVGRRDCRVAGPSPAPRNDSGVVFPPSEVLSSRGAKPRGDLVVYLEIAAAAFALVLGISMHGAAPVQGIAQQAHLVARSVLPAMTFRPGSPATGAFFSAADREAAKANGIPGPSEGPYFGSQPVQGFSSMIPADGKAWWALADNGYAWRPNSADFQLAMYRIDPRWGEAGGPRVLETVILRDPEHHIPWKIVCDQASGTPLPGFSFNAIPPASAACGGDSAARILTGFDLDPESFVRAPDGTFWISEEFGPFLVHVAADGRVLEAPIPFPGVRSPQNPYLDISDRMRVERPNLAASRGPEGLAISPDGSKLYALLEGAVTGDDPQDLRIFVFDVTKRAFTGFVRYRLEMPSQTVNLAAITDASGARAYPDTVAPPSGPVSIGEMKAVNDHQMLVIERDNLGDDLAAPRFKKVFLIELSQASTNDGYVGKTLLLDLLAIPDPAGVGGDGDFFRMPFYTIESVHMVDERTLLIASDNNFPFSHGRARSRSADRSGLLTADDTEIILVKLGTPLEVDRRLLPSAGSP